MTLIELPDWRTCVSQWLRSQDELSDLIDDRLYGEFNPHKAGHEYPLGRITLIGDPELVDGAEVAVWATFQFDWWGGDPSLTWRCAATARSLLKQRIEGVQEVPAGRFIAGLVRAGGIRRTTEPIVTTGTEAGAETTRARPHCRNDVSMMLRPARSIGS